MSTFGRSHTVQFFVTLLLTIIVVSLVERTGYGTMHEVALGLAFSAMMVWGVALGIITERS